MRMNQARQQRTREEIEITGSVNYNAATLETLLDIRDVLSDISVAQCILIDRIADVRQTLNSPPPPVAPLTSREHMEVEKATGAFCDHGIPVVDCTRCRPEAALETEA